MEEQQIILNTEYGPIYLVSDTEIYEQQDGRVLITNEREGFSAVVEQNLSEALSGVENLYRGLADVKQRLKPETLELEVGLKFDVKTGFFLISAGSSVDFKIKLGWKGA